MITYTSRFEGLTLYNEKAKQFGNAGRSSDDFHLASLSEESQWSWVHDATWPNGYMKTAGS